MNPVVKLYLILYNLSLTLGWSYVLYLAFEKRSEHTKIWATVKFPLLICQTAAVLEILHAAVGIVKSNVLITFFQVFSRVYVIWGVLMISPPSTVSIGIPLIMWAWGVTEIIRYGYYFFNMIGLPQALAWFRYTLFIILYPIGVTGELICIYYALDYVKQKKLWSYNMPNALNVSFDYQYAMIAIMLSYIPLFPQMYCHMFAQRRKVLGRSSKTTKVQ